MYLSLYPQKLPAEYFKNEILFLSNIWQGVSHVCFTVHTPSMGSIPIFTEGNYYVYAYLCRVSRQLRTILNCGALSNITIAPVRELPEGARA